MYIVALRCVKPLLSVLPLPGVDLDNSIAAFDAAMLASLEFVKGRGLSAITADVRAR